MGGRKQGSFDAVNPESNPIQTEMADHAPPIGSLWILGLGWTGWRIAIPESVAHKVVNNIVQIESWITTFQRSAELSEVVKEVDRFNNDLSADNHVLM